MRPLRLKRLNQLMAVKLTLYYTRYITGQWSPELRQSTSSLCSTPAVLSHRHQASSNVHRKSFAVWNHSTFCCTKHFQL